MTLRRRMPAAWARLAVVIASHALWGCHETISYKDGEIPFEPNRPTILTPTPVQPYTGANEIVLEAQGRFPTGLDLHQKVIWRTCTPNGGVCHNSKEFPDLRTPASFAASFGTPCNVQPGEYTSVFDGCERPGDRLRLDGGLRSGPIEIAWIEQVNGLDANPSGEITGETPGLHIHLATPLESDNNESWGTAHFERSFVDGTQVTDIEFASFTTQWWRVGDGTHLFGRVRDYQVDDVEELIDVGIQEGDANRNGTFGATLGQGVRMLVPGRPEESYLIGRIRGEMFDTPLPGSRMPLANPPLTIPEMLGLFCLIEGFPAGGDEAYLSNPIDYVNCSYSAAPEDLNLLGNGVTWASRVQPILETNCGGCHSEQDAQGGLVLVGEGVYGRLLMPSIQVPELPLIDPASAETSYLYMKLVDADGIVGSVMPYNPLTGAGRLSEAELGDILTWISNGAVEDQ